MGAGASVNQPTNQTRSSPQSAGGFQPYKAQSFSWQPQQSGGSSAGTNKPQTGFPAFKANTYGAKPTPPSSYSSGSYTYKTPADAVKSGVNPGTSEFQSSVQPLGAFRYTHGRDWVTGMPAEEGAEVVGAPADWRPWGRLPPSQQVIPYDPAMGNPVWKFNNGQWAMHYEEDPQIQREKMQAHMLNQATMPFEYGVSQGGPWMAEGTIDSANWSDSGEQAGLSFNDALYSAMDRLNGDAQVDQGAFATAGQAARNNHLMAAYNGWVNQLGWNQDAYMGAFGDLPQGITRAIDMPRGPTDFDLSTSRTLNPTPLQYGWFPQGVTGGETYTHGYDPYDFNAAFESYWGGPLSDFAAYTTAQAAERRAEDEAYEQARQAEIDAYENAEQGQ